MTNSVHLSSTVILDKIRALLAAIAREANHRNAPEIMELAQ